MTDRLQSSEDFFNLVLNPNYIEYSSQDDSFQRLINCLETLYHMHEWVFEHDRPYAESAWGIILSSTGKVWDYVEHKVPLAKYVRDNANSAKHVKLTRNPSTGAHFFANTVMITSKYNSKEAGNSSYSAGGFIVDEQGSTVNLDQAIKDTFEFWRLFMEQKIHAATNQIP